MSQNMDTELAEVAESTGDAVQQSEEKETPSEEQLNAPIQSKEAGTKRRYDGLAPRKFSTNSKDQDKAFFDTGDWAFGKDDFDFGGEDGEETKIAGSKRGFADLEEDDEELFPSKKMYESSVTGASDHATTTILSLRASLEERDKTIAVLQASVETADAELERWYKAFRSSSILSPNKTPDPDVVLEAVQSLQSSEKRLKDQLSSAKRRESAMLIKLSSKEQEIVNLKTVVHDLKLMMKPPMLQARRLLLDPAIHGEFTRMKKELENAEKKVKELQDDLAAVQFTPHSKNGKMLMAKCRTLQEENEEIGREASEGKIHELETKLAMHKKLNGELKRGYQELYEYVEDLNEEAERLQQLVSLLQNQLHARTSTT
ncbi:hypothetical protein O6H91_07G016000 [Diphasiastrum complanatum]|uniref:Uncharacterized protein n=1 Tax=Diphasiastrum complanatum TaxID=34168 RepID=A0ACC2D2S3_DIPCM|nr:hypothetical protein O6H91_07G016000 [Diphasiastrum complanatum]